MAGKKAVNETEQKCGVTPESPMDVMEKQICEQAEEIAHLRGQLEQMNAQSKMQNEASMYLMEKIGTIFSVVKMTEDDVKTKFNKPK